MADNIYTPRLSSGERIRIRVSDAAMRMLNAAGRNRKIKGVVTDRNTEKRYQIRGASCGLPQCCCDAIAKAL